MEHNDGGPAFPVLDHKIGYHADIRQKEAGISVRDYFAAKAMQAFLSGHIAHYGNKIDWPFDWITSEAWDVADAMLATRDAPP